MSSLEGETRTTRPFHFRRTLTERESSCSLVVGVRGLSFRLLLGMLLGPRAGWFPELCESSACIKVRFFSLLSFIRFSEFSVHLGILGD